MSAFNTKAFGEAQRKYFTEPKNLTDSDIEQLSIIDRDLAERAHLRRIGNRTAKEEEEAIRTKMAMPREQHKKAVTWLDLHLVMEDCFMPLLNVQRYRCQQLEAKALELSKQLEDARTEINYLTWARQQEVPR